MRSFFDQEQIRLIKFWLPGFVTGGFVWLLLLFLVSTPIVRASGLALVIVGMTSALRRMGTAVAVIGGLTLAFSPVFWSQAGGGQGQPATIVLALIAGMITVALVIVISKRTYIGVGFGLVVFAVLFISQVGNPQSIRLTGLVIGWLMFLLVDMLLVTNPRPEDAPLLLLTGHPRNSDGSESARPYHTYGILLLLSVGVLNDPLLTLLVPSIILSITLTRTTLSPAYWLFLGLLIGVGILGVSTTYLQDQAPYMALASWQDAHRWINMVELVVTQFTPIGVILGVLGLSRLSRWYPPLGTVSLIAFAAYWSFGLIYLGNNRDLLLLPLFAIQVIWMSYAVLAISDWVSHLNPSLLRVGKYSVIVLYAVLPTLLFVKHL